MDLKYDVGVMAVQIQLLQMQYEQKQYGMIVTIINDIIELILSHEMMIIGNEIHIMTDCDDEVAIMKVMDGD
jgi:hypothetical protein